MQHCANHDKQHGYCRLEFHSRMPLTVVNQAVLPQTYSEFLTALPLRSETAEERAQSVQPFARIAFIDTASCFGLTFFFLHRRIMAVHAHTKRSPSAHETWLSIACWRRESTVWFYVPLPEGEEIQEMGGSGIHTGEVILIKSLFVSCTFLCFGNTALC